MTDHKCPTCSQPMEERPNMFYWRGTYFPGLVCKPCNSLWDINDQFMKHALGSTETEPSI